MATVTQTYARARDHAGIRSRSVITIKGPASYPNPAGDPFTPDMAFLGMIECFPTGVAVNAAGSVARLYVYDYTNKVMHWYEPTTGLEVADGTDLSGYSIQVEIIGKG